MKILFDFFCNRCQQLIIAEKADEKENQPKELNLGIHIKFGLYFKIPVTFFHMSYHQLSTANNC